jgi:hypothetical protein
MISREELEQLNNESVDPQPLGRVVNIYDNVDISDEELVAKIKQRNKDRKPTYKLRMEYERRLKQRSL